jgi:hypothetical protein
MVFGKLGKHDLSFDEVGIRFRLGRRKGLKYDKVSTKMREEQKMKF